MARQTTLATKEACKAALVQAMGNFSKAARIISDGLGVEISRQRFQNWLHEYDIQYYPKIVRKHMVKTVLDNMYNKAMREGDNYCMGKILDKWGKDVGFTDDHEDDTAQSNELLAQALANATEKDLIKAREKAKEM